MNASKHWMVKQGYRFVVVLVVMALSVGLTGAAPRQSAADALVQIELENDSQLAALAEAGIHAYAHLYRADGSLAVIARAAPAQQQALAAAGFAVQTLEAEAQADGYYLLYGLPETLAETGKTIPLLATVERQAVAYLSADQVKAVEAAGVQVMPLLPQVVTAPAAQAAALAGGSAPTMIPNPAIQQLVNALSQTTLYDYVAQLSGIQPANIGGTPRYLTTRYTLNETYINYATRFTFEHFLGLGLAVDYDYYNMSYQGTVYERRNVVAEQPGVTDPSRIVLVTAHLDSYSTNSNPYDLAPGADDNATGSAAVMAIADILSQQAFDYTIRYVLFTGEEEGLHGSWAYSYDVQQAGDNIIGVLNLDMLGYENFGPPNIELHTRPGNPGDLEIAYLFADAVATYLPGGTLTPLVLQDGKSFSDHYPFWQRGYPAIMAIEDWNDHTPYYHSINDTLATLNMPYYTAFSKAALATFAHMAGLISGGILNGTVIESGSGDPVPGVTIGAWVGSSLAEGTVTGPSGTYQMELDPNTYSLLYMAENYRTQTISNVEVSAGELLTQDVDLAPCATIKNLTLTADVHDPILGENINFEAQVGSGQAPVTYYWDFGDGASGTGAQNMHDYSLPGAYVVNVVANNNCNYPAQTSIVILAEVDPIYLPLVRR